MRDLNNTFNEISVKKLTGRENVQLINHRSVTWQEKQFQFSHAKTGCLNKVRCMEAGCKACGNPAYPECKDSCPLYDD